MRRRPPAGLRSSRTARSRVGSPGSCRARTSRFAGTSTTWTRILHRRISGTEALAATTVVDGDYVGPPSPMDLGQQAELARLPRLPGATLDVQYEHAAGRSATSPSSSRSWTGQVASMRFGRLDDRDALVEVPYLVMALVRRRAQHLRGARHGAGWRDRSDHWHCSKVSPRALSCTGGAGVRPLGPGARTARRGDGGAGFETA